MKRTFTQEYMEELDFPYCDEVISMEPVVSGRWNIHYEIIFRDPADGTHWNISWREGATENQDYTYWEMHGDSVTGVLVVEKEVLVKQWVVVDD